MGLHPALFGSKGDFLVAAEFGRISLWDVDSGDYSQAFGEPVSSFYRIALAADGSRLVSACSDKTVRLWDVVSGNCLQIFKGHTGDVTSLATSSDGKLVASGSDDNSVRLWDADSGKCLRVLNDDLGPVYSVAVSEDNRFLATGSTDKKARLWDLVTGECVYVLEGHIGDVCSVIFRSKFNQLITGSYDSTARFWDLTTGNLLTVFHNIKEGYLWTTPPDEVAKAGWIWTDRPDLINVYECDEDGSHPRFLADDDPQRKEYLSIYNNQQMVMSRINEPAKYRALLQGYQARIGQQAVKALAETKRRLLMHRGDREVG